MAMTAEQELDLTDQAIQNCLLAQQYSAPGQRMKIMASYSALVKRRDDLLSQIDAATESGGSMCAVVRLMEPTL